MVKESRFLVWTYSGLIILLINIFTPSFLTKAAEQPFQDTNQTYKCVLNHIIDGDTIVANCGIRKNLYIRLLGIDAPEMEQIPWGNDSRNTLRQILPIRFSLIVHGVDLYHRQLGIVFNDAEDINLKMIKLGRAVAYKGKDTPQAYIDAEKIARLNKLGIWSVSGHQQNPRLWRRYHPHYS